MLLRNSLVVVVTAVGIGSVSLLANMAMASSVQSTGNQNLKASRLVGTQLKRALLPASEFGRGDVVLKEIDSGNRPERTRKFDMNSANCSVVWNALGFKEGFGDVAFAWDAVGRKDSTSDGDQVFLQAIYRFPGSKDAASFYSAADARFGLCRSLVMNGLSITEKSQKYIRIANHRAFEVVASLANVSRPDVTAGNYELLAIDGDDVFFIDDLPEAGTANPPEAALALRLITRAESTIPHL